MNVQHPLNVFFYRTDTGNEPVRDWLKGLSKSEMKRIGVDIKTVQYGWPIGMPVVRNLTRGLWEVRSNLGNKISRVLFTLYGNNIILLHGFIKKTASTPKDDLDLAFKRMKQIKG
ncbi:MAG: type II toxin-antitoxin system RelE/ParE family toxin [Candidatus Omnitrophica bacterium]|nr:type II toxin-antitoxin system RelE/ParE family toxin [Candidatus Omnitrophota bacterium]